LSDNTRRWISLIRRIEPMPDELVPLIRDGRDREIVAWFQGELAGVRQDFQDFRRSHPHLDRRLGRLEREMERYLREVEQLSEVELEWREEIEIDMELHSGERADDPDSIELDWYRDQVRSHLATIRIWHRHLDDAKAIAGLLEFSADDA